MVEGPYENVPTEHIFHFKDGKKAHNLKDLYDAIQAMEYDDFTHHVDDENNDFANWAEFVYKDSELANDLKQVKDKKRTLEILGTLIGKYDSDGKLIEEKKEDRPSFDAPLKKDKLEPVVNRKQLHEEPVKVSGPSQTIVTHTGEKVHTVSTHAMHKFVVREFLYGTVFGGAVVLIIFLVLRSLGVL